MNEIDMKLNPNLIPAVAVVVVGSAAAAPPAPVIQASSITVTEARIPVMTNTILIKMNIINENLKPQ
jgi:hypothetical protein